MKIDLVKEDCFCSLYQFYVTIAEKMGVAVTGDTLFDCRHIDVTLDVQDELWSYYYNHENWPNVQISPLFLALGPKANLGHCGLYFAEVEDGFIVSGGKEKG